MYKVNETNKKDSKGNKNPNKYPGPPKGFENNAEKSPSQKSKCSWIAKRNPYAKPKTEENFENQKISLWILLFATFTLGEYPREKSGALCHMSIVQALGLRLKTIQFK